MIVQQLSARNFRGYERVELSIGERVTVVTGDNGAGKTNLLEALFFGCVGRSCRTRVDAQTIRFDQPVARVEVNGLEQMERHELAVAIDRQEGKTYFADGAKVDGLEAFEWRPPTTVFMPDRLELIKGAPGARRAHLDQFVAALWPARRQNRRSYAEALAQRNALLARGATPAQMDTWDHELARHGLSLIADRRSAIETIESAFEMIGEELGLVGSPDIRYRTVSEAEDVEDFVDQLRQRHDSDINRGFTTFGPHRDEVVLRNEAREVRTYGSQGQQRLTLLSLLLAECEAITSLTSRRPLILLDDVMSELDATRRALLVDRVGTLGQVLVTATEVEHVPDHSAIDRVIAVKDGTVVG